MAEITLKGNLIHTVGELPKLGSIAKDFTLVKADLSNTSLNDYDGKVKILNIVPSLDTSVCSISAKKFDADVKDLTGIVVLTISRDLPFAQNRFCKAEGIANVITLSDMRSRNFGLDYGVEIIDGPLAGVLSRAVVVLDKYNQVVATEQVPEIGTEPNYDKALNAAKKARA